MLAALVEYGRSALGESALDEWMLPVIATCGLLYVGRVGEEIVGSAEIIRCIDERRSLSRRLLYPSRRINAWDSARTCSPK